MRKNFLKNLWKLLTSVYIMWYNIYRKVVTPMNSQRIIKMFKLTFFVRADGWKDGGYENAHYFMSAREAYEWMDMWKVYCSFVSLESVSKEDFAKDIILL